MHDRKHEAFSHVFAQMNDLYPHKIVDVREERVTPVDERTRFMFDSMLGNLGSTLESFIIVYEPEELFHQVSDNMLRHLRREVWQESGCETLFVQTETPSRVFANRERPVTEALVGLMTMLYFRAHGYMVQRLKETYEGVDDVIAWKSPLTERLRAHRLIEYGCFVDELALLREFGKVDRFKEDKPVFNELIIVEAKSSIRKAVANDGGMNQLLGEGWDNSNPQKYRAGAKQRMVADKLFITFPVCFPTRFPPADSFEEVMREFDTRQPDQRKAGIICWEPTSYHFKDSAEFPHDNMIIELSKYESDAKQLLLRNLYFNELLSLMRKMGVDIRGSTKDEVFSELGKRVQESDIEVILSELDKVLE